MFRAIDVSTSGLVAERSRLDVVAGNIANINSTRDEQGNLAPYQRRFVTFLAEAEQPANRGRGVGVEYRVDVDRQTQSRKVYQPGHPDADAEGNVSYPGFELVQEFVNALSASRAYEANVAAIDLSKTMITQSLRILA